MEQNSYINELFDLKDQVVILTGGMGKLGTEYAKALAKANSRVAIFDLTDIPNETLAELSKNYPIKFFKVDVTKEEEVSRGVQEVEGIWGVPTILINNAGWRASPNVPSKASVPAEDYPMDVWDEVFEINVKAAAICAKIVGKKLIEGKKDGVIINIASQFGLVAADQRVYEHREKIGKNKFVKDASYGASKAALISLTRDLATQWARYGIRVVAFAPGGVFNPKSDKEFVENYSSRVPMGRMANIDEYNGIIVFLASKAASYMTGTVIVADGGWTVW
jgi:NAD(P)-dependent dehydrogenase (short-subunit alcohol dehydrogenase family)